MRRDRGGAASQHRGADTREMQQQDGTTSEDLMARYQRHLDSAAFEEIVSRFLGPALGVAKQLLTDAALAEDAVQETFLRLVRRRSLYVPSMPFSSWFYTILRNVCTDQLRRRARHTELLREVASRGADQVYGPAPEPTERVELPASLREDDRKVLMLRVIHGLPFRDVAAALGISEEAAKKRAQRALRKLREQRSFVQSYQEDGVVVVT